MLAKANFYFLQMRFGEKPPQHFRCVCALYSTSLKKTLRRRKIIVSRNKRKLCSSEALSVSAIIGVVYLYSLSQHPAIF